jgi:small-conductance mechanosensitive channel
MPLNSILPDWLLAPLAQKWVAVVMGMIVIYAIANLLRRAISRRFESTDARYRARKYVTFFAYLAMMVLFADIFSDKLGRFTVALGVMGAGIAFALQEVIASFAGWVAISLGGFYKPGDRVQLGGIKGDVIDIGVLRTTLMEIGEWVQADLYNGRIVRVANSFVFKEPVFNYSTEFGAGRRRGCRRLCPASRDHLEQNGAKIPSGRGPCHAHSEHRHQ